MIRTALSFCLLFGGLLFVSKWLHESTRLEPAKSATDSAPLETATPSGVKPIPLSSAHASIDTDDSSIRLVGFDEPVGQVLENFKHDKAVKGRIADEENDQDSANSEENLAPIVPAREPEIAITPELLELRSKLRECLAYYYFRPEHGAQRSPRAAVD